MSLDELIDKFVSDVRKQAPAHMTTLNIFINCEEYKAIATIRTPEDLKAAGCTMRNLNREFIKDEK